MRKFFHKPPVIICGAHGGGTSYITKLLRFCGFFAGNDAGNILNRKYHEAEGFVQFNRLFGQQYGDLNLFFEESLKKIEREPESHWQEWRNKAKNELPAIMQSFYGDEKELHWTFKGFLLYHFGGFRKDRIWGWKGYLLDLFKKKDPEQPWGWKDPRNSITLPIWKNIFDDLRILVIRKNKTGKVSKSHSGLWFENRATDFQLQYYQSPPAIDTQDDVLYVQFEEVMSDVKKFNELLNWVGLKPLSDKNFRYLKALTKYESPNPGKLNLKVTESQTLQS